MTTKSAAHALSPPARTLFNAHAHALNKQCLVPGKKHVPINKVHLITRVYGTNTKMAAKFKPTDVYGKFHSQT